MKNRNKFKRIIVFIVIVVLFSLGQSGVSEARRYKNVKTVNDSKNIIEIIKNTETTQTVSETENLYESNMEENSLVDLTETNTEELGYYDIPEYVGEPYVEINNNLPYFSDEEYSKKSYEYYSSLDQLGRAGEAIACIGEDLMPTVERGEIGMIKPSGWVQNKYDWVDGKYLYNRCHLIGYQLTGENANESNLITGTRSFNVEGMLPFENEVADYIHETGNHVMYKVTPIYDGDDLLAQGVQIQAISVEDGGYGVCFNVFVYNMEPGVIINYSTGDNWAE